jgi:hypothetical protein
MTTMMPPLKHQQAEMPMEEALQPMEEALQPMKDPKTMTTPEVKEEVESLTRQLAKAHRALKENLIPPGRLHKINHLMARQRHRKR